MSKTVFEPAILTRPVYGVLTPQVGTEHLFVADAQGAEAILDLAKSAPEGFFNNAHIIYINKNSGSEFEDALRALHSAKLYIGPSFEAASSRIKATLANAKMGLALYTAGTEGLMGQTIREAMDAGYSHLAVQTEHRGSLERRVQCVHCKGISEAVTLDPFQCHHCGLHLFVRDHYSRRHAAFQGVRIDAEDPGNIPPSVERFK